MAVKTKSKLKLSRKFYVGSRAVLDGQGHEEWRHQTLDAAVAHARTLCEQTGKDQIVVQIVRHIRQKATPIVVEKV